MIFRLGQHSRYGRADVPWHGGERKMSYKDWMEKRGSDKQLEEQRKQEVKDVIAALTTDAGDSAEELQEIKQMAKDAKRNGSKGDSPKFDPEPASERKASKEEPAWGNSSTCPSCGRALEEGSTRCQYCGAQRKGK